MIAIILYISDYFLAHMHSLRIVWLDPDYVWTHAIQIQCALNSECACSMVVGVYIVCANDCMCYLVIP